MFPNLSGSSLCDQHEVELCLVSVSIKEGVAQVASQRKSWWAPSTSWVSQKWIATGPIALYSYPFVPALSVDIMLNVLPEGAGDMGTFEWDSACPPHLLLPLSPRGNPSSCDVAGSMRGPLPSAKQYQGDGDVSCWARAQCSRGLPSSVVGTICSW